MPDNPNQSRRANGEYGPAIYPKDKPEIQTGDGWISDLARIGAGVRIVQSNIGDSTIENGARVINSTAGDDTVIMARAFVLGSNVGQSSSIGTDSSVIGSTFDKKVGYVTLASHVLIIGSSRWTSRPENTQGLTSPP
ncbi:hypothetical protein [Ferrimicrobium acidiphilum]|uniref:hypothetical protein n=1 Tax=Ferrimicrobium acidiphilum TaxID=121039 RepID=UPI0023F37DD6|nr:hypothetical protein [Ferrimicrobium acidiphilum]